MKTILLIFACWCAVSFLTGPLVGWWLKRCAAERGYQAWRQR